LLLPTRCLLSRGSQVRFLPGAPFPKEFANSDRQQSARKVKSECPAKKVTGLASLRHISRIFDFALSLSNLEAPDRRVLAGSFKRVVILGQEYRRSFLAG